MRRFTSLLGTFLLALGLAAPAAAQEVGEELTATGCLAQDDDGESEFVLMDATVGEAMVAEIDLIPGEGVSLTPHIGHTVRITGVVTADDDEESDAEEAQGEDEDARELSVRVTAMSHVAASCDGGRR